MIEIICSVHSKYPQSGCTHPCITCYTCYTVCTTWLRLFLHEPNKNCDQSLIVICYLKETSFKHGLKYWSSFMYLPTKFSKTLSYMYIQILNLPLYFFSEVNLIQPSVIKLTCGRWVVFSRGLVSSTNKTDCHEIIEILLKVVLNTITLTPILDMWSSSSDIEGKYRICNR